MSSASADTRELQLALLAQGYGLPRWGADGRLGPETHAAIDRWAADHGLDEHGAVSATGALQLEPELVARILAAARRSAPELPPEIVDARDPSLLLPVGGRHPRLQRRGVNPWPRVSTLVLHQMDCRGSTSPGWLRWSRGDLAIHFVACRDGSAAQLYDCNALLWHGHGYNGSSVGLEIEGRYQARLAVADPLRTDHLSDDQVEASLLCIRAAVAEVASHGGSIRYIAAHRQAHAASRRGDPGEEIWQRVARPAQAEHGLLLARTLPAGAPIPECWDPTQAGTRY